MITLSTTRDILVELLNTISINITCEEVSLSSQGTISSHILFAFEKIGLSVIEKDYLTLSFKVKDKEFGPSSIFFGFLGKVRSVEEFQKEFNSIDTHDPTKIALQWEVC
jgi:hypothetical protein